MPGSAHFEAADDCAAADDCRPTIFGNERQGRQILTLLSDFDHADEISASLPTRLDRDESD